MDGLIQSRIVKESNEDNDGNHEKIIRTPAPHEGKISDNRYIRKDPEKTTASAPGAAFPACHPAGPRRFAGGGAGITEPERG